MHDLFGNEIKPPLKHKGRPTVNPCIAVWGKGPDATKCGQCRHHYFEVQSKKYPKCGLRQDKGLAHTDHSSLYATCGRFEPKTN